MSKFYANRERRKRLSDMSERIFGVRNRWQTLVRRHGASIDEVEESFTQAVAKMEAQIEEIRKRKSGEARPEQTEDGATTAGGTE